MSTPDPEGVFINAPFDATYERLFIALVGMLVFLGQKPRCVLEIREQGDGRLARILELVRACRISVHDLSRVSTPVRFNMPFELGIACALKLLHPTDYEVFVLDATPYRLDKTLSDYKGRDPLIHHGTLDGLMACLLDAFAQPNAPPARDVRTALAVLSRAAKQLKSDVRSDSLFRASLFRSLVAAARGIAIDFDFIQP
ncbi:MAG TPA: hypothetical protein VGQ46_08045 [Thermoanaerobaculia bacterium]|nr:hypothetical protein [Thermoanaerobaculia bacterium]